mmetsp:Transcript_7859/g.17642  ORF Transcript_7859/g.17642 Transcript_7859/m.17642 type:complete len:236 (-) Transcript_7859:70-777(-)
MKRRERDDDAQRRRARNHRRVSMAISTRRVPFIHPHKERDRTRIHRARRRHEPGNPSTVFTARPIFTPRKRHVEDYYQLNHQKCPRTNPRDVRIRLHSAITRQNKHSNVHRQPKRELRDPIPTMRSIKRVASTFRSVRRARREKEKQRIRARRAEHRLCFKPRRTHTVCAVSNPTKFCTHPSVSVVANHPRRHRARREKRRIRRARWRCLGRERARARAREGAQARGHGRGETRE